MSAGVSAREALQSRLRGLAVIYDPVLGKTTPSTLEQSSPLWPGPQWSQVAQTATTNADGRWIAEYDFTPAADGAPTFASTGDPLPVVLVVDGDVGRLYSAHQLTPSRDVILPLDDTIAASAQKGDFLDGYFEHLETSDLEGSLKMFEPDGYIRHSNGEFFRGPERLRQDYVNMFKANGGQIRVRFANVTDDGRNRAFECVMPNGRPAIAIYERGANSKIAAIRISL